jgi:putative glutamine amidotransferase
MRVLLSHCDHRPFEVERFGEAWERAGGGRDELVPVTPGNAAAVLGAAPLLREGVILSGGPDVEPWRYGAEPEAGARLSLDPGRDALDIALLQAAEEQHRPVFAICYGCQLLNVALGGTLIQDLTRVRRSRHRVPEPRDHPAHTVRLVGGGGTWLAGLPAEFEVNSRHHQALDRIAVALRTTAVAPDGVVEAVELASDERFVLGVQWHPEDMAAEPHVELFHRFRAACLTSA